MTMTSFSDFRLGPRTIERGTDTTVERTLPALARRSFIKGCCAGLGALVLGVGSVPGVARGSSYPTIVIGQDVEFTSANYAGASGTSSGTNWHTSGVASGHPMAVSAHSRNYRAGSARRAWARVGQQFTAVGGSRKATVSVEGEPLSFSARSSAGASTETRATLVIENHTTKTIRRKVVLRRKLAGAGVDEGSIPTTVRSTMECDLTDGHSYRIYLEVRAVSTVDSDAAPGSGAEASVTLPRIARIGVTFAA